MKYVSVVALVVSGLALFFAVRPEASNAPVKLGYVLSGELMEKAVIAVEARKKLQDQQTEIQANVEKLEKELAAGHEKFIAEQADLGDEARTGRIQALAKQEQDLYRYKKASQEQFQAKERETMQPVLDVINARIQDYGRKNGFTMIWGTLSAGNIIYGDKAADITDEVIAFVNGK